MSSNASKRIVTDFLTTFSSGNVPEILRRMHQDGSWWVSGTIPGISGAYTREQLGDLLRGVVDVYETGALQIVPKRMISEGDVVAVEAESYARLKNGGVYNNHYHFLFVLQDGKVKEVREYMDTQHTKDTFSSPG